MIKEMDLLRALVPTSMLVYVCYGDFFKDLEKLDVDSQLNEIDKMLNKIDVNEEEALETLMDRGAEKAANKAEDILSNMFNTDCRYKCPDGSTPQVRTTHKPSYNGCGSFGITFELDGLPEMTSCCNKHDICYDSCGTVREDCDNEFKECLDKMCKELKKSLSKKEYKGCKDMTKLMYTGTLALGCTPYLEGQEEACICESELKSGSKPDKKSKSRETAGYKKTEDKKTEKQKSDTRKAGDDKKGEKKAKKGPNKATLSKEKLEDDDPEIKTTAKNIKSDSQRTNFRKSKTNRREENNSGSKLKTKDEL